MADKNRNTVQKEVVERIVCSSCDHPTAETVFQRARCELPNISLGTVYRILKRLDSEGVIQEIHVHNAPSRFDKTTCEHAHFVCSECGSVSDLDVDIEYLVNKARGTCAHSVDRAQINLVGVCEHCTKAKSAV